uniref:Uncharacterized protein n=2 Tax=Enterobacteriaceae TaxID=543 RepID=A0A6M6A178_KLEPN|nr:hypothetical protein [Klebsiella pneumoniae]QJX12206.1 hypothetical protein [Klebsiella pneumoniae]
MIDMNGVFPPHAGVIGEIDEWINQRIGIPPYAGVIGHFCVEPSYYLSIPPVCGGYR